MSIKKGLIDKYCWINIYKTKKNNNVYLRNNKGTNHSLIFTESPLAMSHTYGTQVILLSLRF